MVLPDEEVDEDVIAEGVAISLKPRQWGQYTHLYMHLSHTLTEEAVRNGFHGNTPVVMYQLRKEYGGSPPHIAVHGMSLAIQRGECFGLLGPNGAGKTTLISVLTGLYEPTLGHASIAGYDITSEVYTCCFNKTPTLLVPLFTCFLVNAHCLCDCFLFNAHCLLYVECGGAQPLGGVSSV